MLIELITSEFIETLFGIFVSLVPCCVPPLRSGPLAALRLEVRGRKKKKKKEKERIMPSLVATMSALARTHHVRAQRTTFAPISINVNSHNMPW